jgi:nitrite reductase/ring-hydroxylating ferredoxin subunit
MKKKIIVSAIVLSLVLIIVSCSAPTSASVPAPKTVNIPSSSPAPAVNTFPAPPSNPKPTGPIKEKWITAQVTGDAVSIPVNDVKSSWNTAFKIVNSGSTLNFMAYVSNGEIQVRANVCPPCRSIGYSLNNDVLVCDTCGTTFKATDGSGIQGACVKFPKAAIQYKVVNDTLVMNVVDLVDAYQKTLNGKG